MTMDTQDLSIVLAKFGQTGLTWSQGEFAGSGTVDINDLTIVLANYGITHGVSSGVSGVPEPSALVLLGVGTLALSGAAWQRRRPQCIGTRCE